MKLSPLKNIEGLTARQVNLRLGGILALACYLVHAGTHIIDGRYEALLWTCHAGAICVAMGLLFHHRRINAIGVLLLAAGLPLWLTAVLTGGEFYPTTLLIHVVVLYLGFSGAKQLGVPRGDWLYAASIIAILLFVCRAITSFEANVNLAFYITPEFGSIGPPVIHLLSMTVGASLLLWAIETLLQRWCSCEKVEHHEQRQLPRLYSRSN